MKIAVIGKGRVATHMSSALVSAGHETIMCGGRVRVNSVPDDADVVIISVKDDAIASVASELASSTSLVLHTSGSVSIDAIPSARRGVIYPLQSFSFEREVDFRRVPLFLETCQKDDMHMLSCLASTISDVQMPMSSEQRKALHLAAVFSCNFVNHLFEVSHDVLREYNIPFKMLFPLIEETVGKMVSMGPHEAQTGPALRGDERVMQKHIDMLENPLRKTLYQTLSRSICETHKQ